MKKVNVDKLFDTTKDAYSFGRYGAEGWRKSIENLAFLGFTEKQIEWIMRSKLTRWAGDYFGTTFTNEDGQEESGYGNFTGDEIVAYYGKYPKEFDDVPYYSKAVTA